MKNLIRILELIEKIASQKNGFLTLCMIFFILLIITIQLFGLVITVSPSTIIKY